MRRAVIRPFVLVLAAAAAPAQQQGSLPPAAPPQPESQGVPGLGFETLPHGVRYRVATVPGNPAVCAVLALPFGSDDDPAGQTGRAAVVAELIRMTQDDTPREDQLAVDLTGPAILVAGIRPVAELDSLLDELAAIARGSWLGGEHLADRIETATGRVVLRADDALHIFPGPMLWSMGRRTVLKGTPAGRHVLGLPEQLRALTADDLRPLQHAGAPVVVVLGGAAEDAATERVKHAFAEVAASGTAPKATVHDALPAVTAVQPQERVAAPYVALALPAPDPRDPDALPFWIGMEVLRGRAAAALPPERGREASAYLVPFSFDETGPPLVELQRRGRNGETWQATRDEVARFVDGLFGNVTPDEIATAAARVAWRLQVPPYPEPVLQAMTNPRSLYPRARLLALAELLGWSGDVPQRLGQVSVRTVAEVLAKALAPEGRQWLALVPK